MIKFVDWFAGIGGFRLGLEKANQIQGANEDTYSRYDMSNISRGNGNRGKRPSFNCVWANDNDRYACQIYRKQFREVYEGDIRTVDASTIPEHDLLCAGFPCQSFSIAGKRRGFEDTRGTLFFEICRVLRAKRPGYLFLENVKGLLSHDDGHTFQTIIRTLDELGYDCQWQVLNSKNFGVPQNRERVFIIGHLRGQPRPKVFPVGETNELYTETDGRISHAIDSNYHKGWLDNQQRTMIHTAYPGETREYGDISPTISTPSGGGHLPMVAMRWNRTEKGRQSRKEAMAKGKDQTPFSGGCRELVPSEEDVSGCITNALAKDALVGVPNIAQALQTDGQLRSGTSWGTDKPQSARNIRRLTPLECERLQGFPDGWTKKGMDKKGNEIGISDTQRYRALGNAVTTNVITAIGNRLENG